MAAKLEDIALGDIDPKFAKEFQETRRGFLMDLLEESLTMLLSPAAAAAKMLPANSLVFSIVCR